jgi:mannose-1-phosphate guanylyltransferase / mannose-6-phosphate isomerase
MDILTIILAGGSGKRLWPLSRTSTPKQFIRLPDGSTLFEKTIERALEISKDILVITNKAYEYQANHLVKKYFKDDNCINILFESKGKNSGPAILAGLIFNKKYLKNQKKILVLPSDHCINDTYRFKELINSGIDLTEKYHVTFGVQPTSISCDCGYL